MDGLCLRHTHQTDRLSSLEVLKLKSCFRATHGKHQSPCIIAMRHIKYRQQYSQKQFIHCLENSFYHILIKYNVLTACNLQKSFPVHTRTDTDTKYRPSARFQELMRQKGFKVRYKYFSYAELIYFHLYNSLLNL